MKSHSPASARSLAWTIPLALVYLYIAWGTTYLAIKKGVRDEQLPPALFAGSRVLLAGLLLLAFLAWRGKSLRLTAKDFFILVATGIVIFVGGNGMLTAAEMTVDSGVASILAATTPIWVAVFGLLLPQGERLRLVVWLGLLMGMVGVVFLLAPGLTDFRGLDLTDPGPLFMMGSTLCWAVGILLLRHVPAKCDHLVSAAYQMIIGGGVLTVLGIGWGELGQMPAQATTGAVVAFVYLLVFGSLLGFIAFNFLLRNVSAALVGTHAYVNPIIAILIGVALDGEEMTGWMTAGILSVLMGVFLVRWNQQPADETVSLPVEKDTDHPLPRPELQQLPAQR